MIYPFVSQFAAMADQSRRPAFFWLVLLICGVYAGFCAVTIDASLRHYGTEKDPGWNVRGDATGWIVSDVNASGPAARHIEPGDRLIALNGDGRAAVLGIANWADLRAGDTYRVDLERRGRACSPAESTVGRRKM
jgi:predicted metalloprotease with PDZ domain